jgi:hypothetical protein
MAVTYVKDFSFPTAFGFHKPNAPKPREAGAGNSRAQMPTIKSGPSVVNAKATHGGGKLQTGAVSKFSKGGATTPMPYREGGRIQPPVAKYSGHKIRMPGIAKKGEGAGDLIRVKGTDHTIAKTTREKSSGLQKPAFAKGGSTTPQPYHGGGCTCSKCSGGGVKMAKGGMVQVQKKGWNREDSVSPGSPARMPPGQSSPNKAAAKNKFATSGENTPPATKQDGAQRMSGWSDFAKGGQVKTEDRFERGMRSKVPAPDKQSKGDGMEYKSGGRIKNLGKYAHGGKVKHRADRPHRAHGGRGLGQGGRYSGQGQGAASQGRGDFRSP